MSDKNDPPPLLGLRQSPEPATAGHRSPIQLVSETADTVTRGGPTSTPCMVIGKCDVVHVSARAKTKSSSWVVSVWPHDGGYNGPGIARPSVIDKVVTRPSYLSSASPPAYGTDEKDEPEAKIKIIDNGR